VKLVEFTTPIRSRNASSDKEVGNTRTVVNPEHVSAVQDGGEYTQIVMVWNGRINVVGTVEEVLRALGFRRTSLYDSIVYVTEDEQ
jgi:hypothetical protein